MPSPSLWQRLWSRPRSRWLLGIPIGGFLALALGAGALVGFNGVMHYTNSNEFCYLCHVGMDTVVEEYQASAHFKNSLGFVASCSDCHVPQEFIPKMVTKILAAEDVYVQMTGAITLDNFEQHRPALAAEVLEIMRRRDSRECRNCHTPARMDLQQQSRNAARRHQTMAERGQTCVDCHDGIAHKLPQPVSAAAIDRPD